MIEQQSRAELPILASLYFSNYVTRLGKPSFQYLLLFLRTKWHILIRNTNIAPFLFSFVRREEVEMLSFRY